MKKIFLLFFLLFILPSSLVFAQANPQPPAPSGAPNLKNWRVSKEKIFPFYKVQIQVIDNSKNPFGLEASRALIFNKSGQLLSETKNLILEPDPKINIMGWKEGSLLDLDNDGYEDLVLKGFSGGGHCCYSYQIFSLGPTLKKLGFLKLNDCGDQIQLEDLNQDKIYEIISCNAFFTYLKDFAFSQSPFPPTIFALDKSGHYTNVDVKYPQVFARENQKKQTALQSKTASINDVLEYTLNLLLQNKSEEAWKAFDSYYNLEKPKKEEAKEELAKRWEAYQSIKH